MRLATDFKLSMVGLVELIELIGEREIINIFHGLFSEERPVHLPLFCFIFIFCRDTGRKILIFPVYRSCQNAFNRVGSVKDNLGSCSD